MSSALAVAGVTTAIVRLLNEKSEFEDLKKGLKVTKGHEVRSLAPKEAEKTAESTNLTNVFLYRTTTNGAWRNQPPPDRVRAGETGHPPLPLDLHYLVSAYGEAGEETTSQLLMGMAMRLLHDHPVLTRESLKDLLRGASGLHEQIEEIKISLRPMGDDELNKLWTPFGAAYRLSAAYDVSVVLIDSARPVITPVPVTRRGRPLTAREGNGFDETAEQRRNVERIFLSVDPITVLPTLRRVEFPTAQQPATRLGERIVLQGVHLGPDDIVAAQLRFEHPRGVSRTVLVAEADRTPASIVFRWPDEDAPGADEVLPCGVWTIQVEERDPNGPTSRPSKVRTNALPLALAPLIVSAPVADAPPNEDQPPKKIITIRCNPHIVPGQRAALLVGSVELLAPSPAAITDTIDFEFEESQLPTGTYPIRLRTDGIDSFLIDYSQQPPQFDPTQFVEVSW